MLKLCRSVSIILFAQIIHIFVLNICFSFSINFITSEDGNIDFQNIACQLDINFTENKIQLRTIKNGIPEISPDESYKEIPATELLRGKITHLS